MEAENSINSNNSINIILKNQEKRTIDIIELEKYFTKLIYLLEKEWKETKKLHNWDYSNKCKSYIEGAQILNNELKTLKQNILDKSPNSKEIKVINRLLSLEESNYKLTISLFLKKLNFFELLKKDADDEEFNQNEMEAAEIKMQLTEIRDMISDLITTLKYEIIK